VAAFWETFVAGSAEDQDKKGQRASMLAILGSDENSLLAIFVLSLGRPKHRRNAGGVMSWDDVDCAHDEKPRARQREKIGASNP
jgi:hypothetical protein